MKLKGVAVVTMAAWMAATGIAQELAPKPTGRLDVKTAANNKSIDRQWQADWGSYQRGFKRSIVLDAEVSTTGRTSYAAKLKYFIIGKGVTGVGRSLISQGEQAITVAPGAAKKVGIDSGAVASQDNRYYALGRRDTSGSKIEGWVVRLYTESGQLLDERSSATYLSDWLKTQSAGD